MVRRLYSFAPAPTPWRRIVFPYDGMGRDTYLSAEVGAVGPKRRRRDRKRQCRRRRFWWIKSGPVALLLAENWLDQLFSPRTARRYL